MRKKKKTSLNDIQKFKIENLAALGFSDRYIAYMTFGTPMDDESEFAKADRRRSVRHRKKKDIKLSDWRQGRSQIAQSYAKHVVSGRRKRSKAG